MHIHPATLEFLKVIREKNSRAYFASIKPLYDDILANLKDVITHLAQEFATIDPDFNNIDPKQCLFRIYRDARRLRPWDYLYKYHRWIVIGPTWTHSQWARPYIQLSPWGSFVWWGVWRGDTAQLYKIRSYLVEHGDEFQSLMKQSTFQEYFWDLQGASLVWSPRGFTKETKHIDLIKQKQFLIKHSYSNKEILSDTFLDEIIYNFRVAQPFYNFLNAALLR